MSSKNCSELRDKMIAGQLAMMDETIHYYSEDISRRAMRDGTCVYVLCDGEHEMCCVVGRKLPEGLKQQVREGKLSNGINSISFFENLEGRNFAAFDEWRKTDEYLFLTGKNSKHREHDRYSETGTLESFSEHLQLIHDSSSFWKPGGLSDLGREHVETFRRAIESGAYTTPHETYDDGTTKDN